MVEQSYAQVAEDALCHGRRQIAINECETLTYRHRRQVAERQDEQTLASADRQMIVDDPANNYWRHEFEQGAREHEHGDEDESAPRRAQQLGKLTPKAFARCRIGSANRSNAHVTPFAVAGSKHVLPR